MLIVRFFCLAMFFCLPFTHGFAVNFVACPAVVCAGAFVFLGWLFVRSSHTWFSKSDFFIFGLWVLLCISFGFGTMSQTAINHGIAYTTFILICYLGGSRTIGILVEKDPKFWNKIMEMILFMLFFSCAYALIDWCVFLATGSEIPIPRALGGGNGSAAGVVRARGFSGEPSGLANFILMWSPLALWYLFSSKKNFLVKCSVLAVIVAAFFATFSAKGIISTLAVAPFVGGFLALKRGLNPTRIASVALVAVIAIAIVVVSGLGKTMFEAVAPKFFGSDIYNARFEQGANVVTLIEGFHWLVGYGPASYVTLVGHDGETFLSGFAYLLGDAGILGLSLFGAFLASQLLFVKKLKFSGLKCAFLLMLYFTATGEVIGPTHYSLSAYLAIALLHTAVVCQKKIWLPRHAPFPPFPPNAPVPLPPGTLPPSPQKISFHENSSHY